MMQFYYSVCLLQNVTEFILMNYQYITYVCKWYNTLQKKKIPKQNVGTKNMETKIQNKKQKTKNKSRKSLYDHIMFYCQKS